jgi:hypothetical protein
MTARNRRSIEVKRWPLESFPLDGMGSDRFALPG